MVESEQYAKVHQFIEGLKRIDSIKLKEILYIAFKEGAAYHNDIGYLESDDIDINFDKWCKTMFKLK